MFPLARAMKQVYNRNIWVSLFLLRLFIFELHNTLERFLSEVYRTLMRFYLKFNEHYCLLNMVTLTN